MRPPKPSIQARRDLQLPHELQHTQRGFNHFGFNLDQTWFWSAKSLKAQRISNSQYAIASRLWLSFSLDDMKLNDVDMGLTDAHRSYTPKVQQRVSDSEPGKVLVVWYDLVVWFVFMAGAVREKNAEVPPFVMLLDSRFKSTWGFLKAELFGEFQT